MLWLLELNPTRNESEFAIRSKFLKFRSQDELIPLFAGHGGQVLVFPHRHLDDVVGLCTVVWIVPRVGDGMVIIHMPG